MMKTILAAIVVVFVIAGLAPGQSAKQKAAIELEVRKLDYHANAILLGDLAALDKIWTTDFMVNNPFNEIDRANRIRNGAVTYSSFERVPLEYITLLIIIWDRGIDENKR